MKLCKIDMNRMIKTKVFYAQLCILTIHQKKKLTNPLTTSLVTHSESYCLSSELHATAQFVTSVTKLSLE
jgi:hypothetical protein